MKRPVVFMYPGQGAQYHQMARQLYQSDHVFRSGMDRCDALARRWLPRSLIEIVYGADKAVPFDRLQYTSAALLAVEYSLTEVLRARGLLPDYLLGYSLGEVTSCVVAGALSLNEALGLLAEQSDLFEELCPPAFMLAVVASPALMDDEPELFTDSWMASRNSAQHFVVTGTRGRERELIAALSARGVLTQALPVGRGFHSPLIEGAHGRYLELVSGLQLGSASLPVTSCASGTAWTAARPDVLWRAVRAPVEFARAVRTLERVGPCLYVDVGPSGTLAGFVKQNLEASSKSRAVQTLNPFGDDQRTLGQLLGPALRAWEAVG